MQNIILRFFGIIIMGLLMNGCVHNTLGQKITPQDTNDPYALYNGISVPFDLKQAFKLAKTQCDNNNLSSCFLYAYMLENGEGTQQDTKKAFEIFQKSCNGIEQSINVNENGGLVTKKVILQDKNSCYFVAKSFFEKKDYIEAWKKYEIFMNEKTNQKMIALDNTNDTTWKYRQKTFNPLPFDNLNSYHEPKEQITPSQVLIYEENKNEVILYENISKLKTHVSNILAYYDFRIKNAEENNKTKEAFFFKKNKAILFEAIGEVKKAENIYKQNCELNDNFSCIYYKNIKTRGSNLK